MVEVLFCHQIKWVAELHVCCTCIHIMLGIYIYDRYVTMRGFGMLGNRNGDEEVRTEGDLIADGVLMIPV